jgi:hypothetical protein
MNTPAHVILNLFLLRGEEKKSNQAAVTFGALLPDLPIYGFYFYEKVIQKVPESVIWRKHYLLGSWQNFFDVFHSIPLAAAGLALSVLKRAKTCVLLFVSILLHLVTDFFLHNDDAHGHFFPLTDWRFYSPVSYWDPQHHGTIATWIEIGVTVFLGIFLIRYFKLALNRVWTILWLLFYMAYMVYVYVFWLLPHN